MHKAVLAHHGISANDPVFLSVPDMVARLGSGDIDAGFFVSHIPSEPLKTVLNDKRYLHDLINDRVKLAKENLTAALAEDLRDLAHESDLSAGTRRERLQRLEERVWTYFQKGELDASHQAILIRRLTLSWRRIHALGSGFV